MERRQVVVSGLGLLGVAAAGLAAEPIRNVSPNVSPEIVAEIKATLEQHDKAFAVHDLEGVMSTYRKSPQTVLMGTGPGEIWSGLEEIADAYKHFFADFDKGAQQFKYSYVSGAGLGDAAWLSVLGSIAAGKGEVKREFGINISSVLVKDAGKWRFAQLHFSNLTGPEK